MSRFNFRFLSIVLCAIFWQTSTLAQIDSTSAQRSKALAEPTLIEMNALDTTGDNSSDTELLNQGTPQKSHCAFGLSLMKFSPLGNAASGSKNVSSLRGDIEWDKGDGVEFKATYWPIKSRWGFGASISKVTWETIDYSDYTSSGYESRYNFGYVRLPQDSESRANYYGGNVDMMNYGVHATRILFSGTDTLKHLNCNVELGLKGVFIDSKIRGLQETQTRTQYHYKRSKNYNPKLEYDEALVGYVAINLGYDVAKNVNVFAQLGAQFDVINGSASLTSELEEREIQVGKADLQATYLQFGLSARL